MNVRSSFLFTVFVALTGCGMPVPDAVRLTEHEALQLTGFQQATHVLTGPAFVPEHLRDKPVAMDRVALSAEVKRTITSKLRHLTRRTPWRKVNAPDVPIGPFFRSYRNAKPCGPWLMVFPFAGRRRGPVWQLSAFRMYKNELQVMILYAAPEPLDLTGSAEERESVSPSRAEFFPLVNGRRETR